MQRLVDEEEEETKEEDVDITAWPTQLKTPKWFHYTGIILAVISALLFSSVSFIVKWMVNVHPAELSIFRFAGILLAAIPIVIWRNENPFPKGKRLMLVLRSFTGASTVILMFYAFRHMPLGDASVLIFSFPVFVAIFAHLCLKEPCGLFHVIITLLTMFGITLISSPPFIFGSSNIPVEGSDQQLLVEENWWGPLAAISAAMVCACDFILVRVLKDVNFSVILVNFGVVSLIFNLTITWGLDGLCWPQCGNERFLTVALALLSFAGQSLLAIALQLEQAGPVAIARSSDIVFAFIWQIAFFQEVPDLYTIVGGLLVTTSIILNAIRTWMLTLPETSMLRKTFFVFEM